jgi:hypothetical protein
MAIGGLCTLPTRSIGRARVHDISGRLGRPEYRSKPKRSVFRLTVVNDVYRRPVLDSVRMQSLR